MLKSEKYLLGGKWFHMSEAPKDKTIQVFCPAQAGLPPMITKCKWHPDAGFCVCMVREPVMWRFA